MSKVICYCFAFFILLSPSCAFSQGIIDGGPLDSTLIRFNSGTIPDFIPDTAATPLWQIGHGHKSFFGNDTLVQTMMTDTLQPYHINANNFFIIKVYNIFNTIIDFWHKYETDSSHDGGIVEWSIDKGATWQNVKGDCNSDSNYFETGVLTSNFYTFNDTLRTGEPAFSGIRDTVQYSRIQFFIGLPEKSTEHKHCDLSVDTMYIRFRFVSDTTADTLAGWEIDSVKIEHDIYAGGGVRGIGQQQKLAVYPNPSINGIFNFPALENERQYTLSIYNTLGARIINTAYSRSLDLGAYPKGFYFYKVSGGGEYYSGQLTVE